jgi:hypothetical protein
LASLITAGNASTNARRVGHIPYFRYNRQNRSSFSSEDFGEIEVGTGGFGLFALAGIR